MLLFKLFPVFQPPHGRRWVPHGRTTELDGVGRRHRVQPLLHFVRVCPVGRSCFKQTRPERSELENQAPFQPLPQAESIPCICLKRELGRPRDWKSYVTSVDRSCANSPVCSLEYRIYG